MFILHGQRPRADHPSLFQHFAVVVSLVGVEQRRVYSIYYYGTLTLPYKRRGERAVEAVAVRVDSGREQETLLFHTRYRLLYILSYKRDGHSCIA